MRLVITAQTSTFVPAIDIMTILRDPLSKSLYQRAGLDSFVDSCTLMKVGSICSQTAVRRLPVDIFISKESHENWESIRLERIAGGENAADMFTK